MKLKTALEPLNKENEAHLQLMYEVRTHLEVAARLSGIPPKNYEEHVNYLTKVAKDRVFFIITASGAPCGYCQLVKRLKEIELGFAIHPAWWGRSIGSRAVELLIQYARKEYQSHSICLIVKKDNLAALHIYKKNGFAIHSSDDEKNEYLMYLT